MAVPTGATAKALEKKALAAEVKSDGMRMLLEADYSVTQVKTLFEVPYGFAYGVAKRAGLITPTPRVAKPKAEKPATKPAAKKPAAKKPAAKKPAAKAAPAAKAPARAPRVTRRAKAPAAK